MASALVYNGDFSAAKSPASTSRVASVYSEVQNSRLDHSLPLPSVLKSSFKVVHGPPSSAAGNPDEIAKLFPGLFGQPSAMLVPGESSEFPSGLKLKIGVVLSGGQAPGGHNVISGIFDYLQDRCKGSTVYGFRGGPAGIMKCKYVVLTPEFIYPYRNQGGFDMICSGRDKIETPEQFKQAQETALKLDLDGLVVIGGDDSNTNACLLAENFRSKNMKTRVIGCPKTIDGDLKCKEVPASFGFDTACKIYSEMIGNVMIDARSTGKYYHFVRLMGRAASHITLECALQTHPNITLIGEEVAAKKETLKNVSDYIADVICKRGELGYNYGVILIPEGLIDFIPEVQHLIAELNEILAQEVVDEGGLWKKKLNEQSLKLFDLLPPAIQEQLMLERDPHGNVQVAKIETEKMFFAMVGIMATTSRENVARLMNSAKFAIDIPSKLEQLRQLKDDLSQADSVLLSEFLPSLLDLHSDQFSPVRKFVTKMIGDIGLKHMEFIPDIIPVLITVLKDGTPAVARQAITCGIDLFRSTLVKVAIQGLYSSELDNSLESSWAWVLKFRDEIYLIAFQPGSDGTRLLALKFVEAVILLYTPDPSGSSEPPPHQAFEGKFPEFNISWLRGGHPVLNVGDLSIEASQGLGLLLDQLRFPTVKSLSNSMIIVLINSLSAIARKRPAFYGRILPVLLGFDPSGFVNKGVCVSGVHHALKNAFLCCLKCTHPGAAPWQDRLAGALRDLKAGGLVEQALLQVCQINGSVEGKDDSPITLEEKPSIKGHDAVHGSARRKRPGVQDVGDSVEDDDVSGKRIRPTPIVSEGSEKDRDRDDIPSSGVTTSRDVDNGPVQQLVAMFGTLVAQGEKAIGPLEILISSISADLLAEVVMANMRHLPPNRPKAEGDEEPLPNMGSFPNIVSCDTQFKHLSSILAEMLSMSSTPMQMDSVSDAQRSSSNDIEDTQGEEDNDASSAGVNYGIEQGLVSLPVSSPDEVPSSTEDGFSALPPEVPDVGNLGGEIPGLDSAVHSVGLAETPIVSSLAPMDLEDASQEQGTSLGSSVMELVPSISTDRSEEHSPKAAVTDVSSRNSLTVTSVGLSTQFILPKMSAPVINLADEEKDQLQKLAFTRIVEAYKQIADAGGSHVHFSLLAYLGVEFPLELDPWKILQKHVLSDYMNHEGHELTLRVLYKLFGEAEERDFFSSSTATSVYEMFILTVAEALRDSFPASDKSLSRLLGEAPYLPKSIFNLLERLCSPGSSDKDEELPSGDRVTQGLSAVWSLILLRPPIRDVCLKIALQSAVHHLEEVRMKAIRLVANKLYPLSAIAQQIEEFAKEMLHSVSNGDDTMDRIDGDRTELQKDLDKPSTEQLSVGAVTKDISSDTSQSCVSPNLSSSSLMEAQRCMSLYFALCTKKHSLFREIFVVYKSTSNAVKQAVHRQIPILVRTIGSSSEFLEIISDPPTGSESLLMQVLHTLTDGIIPSPELILTIRKLYDTKVKDVEVLIPILSYLPKDEVLRIFPHLVNLPLDKFQAALARVLQGSSQSGPLILPAEVLIAIHGIDPDRDGIPLKKVTDACNACFEQRLIFTQQVLAKVLNQLVEQIPLPLLFMRTVLQAIGAFPALVEFIMEILSRLVNKQIWKYPKLWVGFLKCALLTKPQSFSVLLQLPPAQLENALNRTAALKAPLIAHASQPNIRSSLPRSVLVVLGIASETQNTSQVQTTPTCTVDAANSDKEAVTEKSKESSSAS